MLAIPERLKAVFTTMRYTNPRLPLPYLPVHHFGHDHYSVVMSWVSLTTTSLQRVWTYVRVGNHSGNRCHSHSCTNVLLVMHNTARVDMCTQYCTCGHVHVLDVFRDFMQVLVEAVFRRMSWTLCICASASTCPKSLHTGSRLGL